jgi:hypothetical protein
MFSWGRWFGNDRVAVNVSCYPHHWGMHWRDNGGRKPNECWDTTLCIGPWSFSFTLFGIGRWAWLLWLIPKNKRWIGEDRGRLFIGW